MVLPGASQANSFEVIPHGSAPSTMQIVQATWGVFHHFDLAREMEKRGHLLQIYSSFPWARLKREGLPHSKVRTFPWLHLTQMLVGTYIPSWHSARNGLGYATTMAFDEWLDWLIPQTGVDALIALSGAGLKAGKHLQERGGIYICDRGSTHQLYQERLVNEELRRWGVSPPVSSSRYALYRREVNIYETADAITVPSSFAARSFIESGVAKDKVHVIPYGVRLENFHPVAEPAPDTFEVLFVGQVGLRKGVPYLLHAFAGLRHPRKRLRFVGAVHPDFKSILAQLPQSHVEFVGPQPQSEVARYMSSSHVMVLPSIEEGLALVQGQAMACGCPVLASTNTGSEDLFSDGIEGFIVPIRSPEALQERLQQLADDPALQRRMSEAALLRVRHLGGWADYGDRWVVLLKRLLAASPRPRKSAE
jgi:alpha-maltose-1-phosphate synthase